MQKDVVSTETSKKRVGFIVPRSNTVCELEFNKPAPHGISFHAARMRYVAGVRVPDMSAFMLDAMLDPLRDLALCDVDLALLACSTASMACDRNPLAKTVQDVLGKPFLDVWDVTLDAIDAVGARRVALFTPYVQEGNDAVARVLGRRGMSVVAEKGLGLNTSPERFRAAGRLTPKDLERHVSDMPLTGADCVLLACCDMPTLDAIPRLEERVGMPVISTNQALYRAALRSLGIAQAPAGPGMLSAPPRSASYDGSDS